MAFSFSQCNPCSVIIAAGEYIVPVNPGWKIAVGQLQPGTVIKTMLSQIGIGYGFDFFLVLGEAGNGFFFACIFRQLFPLKVQYKTAYFQLDLLVLFYVAFS